MAHADEAEQPVGVLEGIPERKKQRLSPKNESRGDNGSHAINGVAAANGTDASPDGQGTAEAPGPLSASQIATLTEDAPQTSEAHNKVRYANSSQSCPFMFKTSDGQKIPFQTTVRAAGSSKEAAMRIARMCYHKFELGSTKPEVEQYRAKAYERLRNSMGITPKERKRKPRAPQEPKPKETKELPKVKAAKGKKKSFAIKASDLKQLNEEGRLQGALRIFGRDAKKKNATVNGIYLLSKKFEGTAAYELFCPPGNDVDDLQRWLFYAKDKSRWKISEALGHHHNFAFLKVTDGGKSPPSAQPDAAWMFYDGKDSGWQQDLSVKCVAVKWTPPKDAKQETKRSQPEEEESSDSASSSDTDSEGGDTCESSDDPSADPAGAAAVPARPPVRTRSLACAKMMVRAGRRCSCHFRYVRDCPGRLNRRSRSRDRD